jgi:uncharacterized protein (TIGR02687 family)
MDKIQHALTKLFERHRIIFWYDVKKELRSDYENLDMPEVEKLEINNNEFNIKYRVLRELPEQRFLLYHEGPKPTDLDNWLLDVELAHGELRADQAGIWLSELGLGLEFVDIIHSHLDFFNAAKRRESLKELLHAEDTQGMIRLKMMAVCSTAEPRIDDILENLLVELSEKRDEKIRLVERCGLDEFLWGQLNRFYGYQSKDPGIKDFAVELYKSCYAMGTDREARLNSDALVFLKRWKDSRKYGNSFELLSQEYEDMLSMAEDLSGRNYRDLIDLDYFCLIDQKIISGLVKEITDRTITTGDCALIVRQRRQGHWYAEFMDLYKAVEHAANFFHIMDELDLSMDSMSSGFYRYCKSWYKLDQYYRKFMFHVRRSGQTTIMAHLNERIENLYSNSFLLKINNDWQSKVDAIDKWTIPSITSQKGFFEKWILPFTRKNNKVFVIISDGFRYEVGEEFLGLIRREDRYEANLEAVLSALPSYTQLGMAALLPNKQINLADNDSGTVFVDGMSSQGTENRRKILENSVAKHPTVIKADDLLGMNKDDCRALIKDNDVVYIYHNRIDATGDKRETEERTFEAVEEALQELLKIVKKLVAANANNLIVTADHGFIYQNRALDESDFAGEEATGDTVLLRDRRFVVGMGLNENTSLKKFTAAQLGLEGDLEFQIPKSINRLRLKGSGSRYVHGGASLQEVVIPVLEINKKRQSDVSAVEVVILKGATSAITSGQLTVVFYQTQPADDKVQPRYLKAGIYTQAGELISDSHELAFDLKSKNARERELRVQFILTREADKANEQDVILRLDEKVSGTTHEKEYKSERYLLRRSFTSDFDF